MRIIQMSLIRHGWHQGVWQCVKSAPQGVGHTLEWMAALTQ